MAVRRTRPPQPLAPYGLTGHLVGFVEALREQGIAVGPSETVDAGRVLGVLGVSDRQALREGLACALLRRADHRATYDALFDLWWPAALGGRTLIVDDTESGEVIPQDIEAMRAMLVDLLTANPDIADLDTRLVSIWYYCLVDNRVEPEKGCANSERLGPYETEEQASHAFEIARKRNDEWDAGEQDWTQRYAKGREGDAAHDLD